MASLEININVTQNLSPGIKSLLLCGFIWVSRRNEQNFTFANFGFAVAIRIGVIVMDFEPEYKDYY